MTKPPPAPAVVVTSGVLAILIIFYFAFPMWLLRPFRDAYVDGHLSLERYQAVSNMLLLPIEWIADRFPVYERWVYGTDGRFPPVTESQPIRDW